MSERDKVFAGSIPQFYDTLMVPLIFEDYAADVAELVAVSSPDSVLETAAGSGVVTRVLHGEGPVAGKIKAHVIVASRSAPSTT